MPESWGFFPLAPKGLFLLCLTHLLGAFDLGAFDKQGYETLLQKHCIECHGLNGKVKGKVDLLPYAQGGDIRKDEELLQMVMEVIDFGEMPPEEKDPIPEPEREQLGPGPEATSQGGRPGGCGNSARSDPPNDPLAVRQCGGGFAGIESGPVPSSRADDAGPLRIL